MLAAFAAWAWVLVVPSRATAEIVAPRTMSLRQVVQQAQSTPPAVLAALDRAEIARARWHSVQALAYPTLTVTAGASASYVNRPILPEPEPFRVEATTSSLDTSVIAQYPLFDLGRRAYASEAERQGYISALERARAVRVAAARLAAELYVAVLADNDLIAIAKRSIERRATQLEIVRELVTAGIRPAADVRRAELERLNAEMAVTNAETSARLDGIALATAMGMDPSRPIRVEPIDDRLLSLPDVPDMERALAQRSELAAARADRNGTSAAASGAGAERYPMLGAQAAFSVNDTRILNGLGVPGTATSAAGGLVLTWRVLDLATWRQHTAALEAAHTARRDLSAEELRIRAEITMLAQQVAAARVRTRQMRTVLEAAVTTHTMQLELYRAGASSLLELIDAMLGEDMARVECNRVEFALRVACIRLRIATDGPDGL